MRKIKGMGVNSEYDLISFDVKVCLPKYPLTFPYRSSRRKLLQDGTDERAAMGSSLSPVLSNIFMEEFEPEALLAAVMKPEIRI